MTLSLYLRKVDSELIPCGGAVEGGMVVDRGLPGAVQVVGHQVDGVQVLGQSWHVVPRVDHALAVIQIRYI